MKSMYSALFILMGLALAVPVSAVALLAGWLAAGFVPQTGVERIRRTTATVLGVGVIVAMTIPGGGWLALTFVFPLCLAIGEVLGYLAIERLAKRSAAIPL